MSPRNKRGRESQELIELENLQMVVVRSLELNRSMRSVDGFADPLVSCTGNMLQSTWRCSHHPYETDEKSGISRRMNASNSGTVNAVSPWAGLRIIPFEISVLRMGATLVTFAP